MVSRTNVLVMTATITPPAGVPNLVRNDPATRLEDYRIALEFYLSLLDRGIDAIVFAENSNTCLDSLRDMVERKGLTDRVEFLGFFGLDYPPSYGRGSGEMRLLDYFMDHSETIRLKGDDITIWKVTGRYKIPNLRAIISGAPSEFDLYCDMRDGGIKWFDMRLIAWSPAGYESLLRGVHSRIREDISWGHGGGGEAYLYREVLPLLGRCRAVTSYRIEPWIEGVRAFDNKNWAQGRQRLVYYFRSIQRMIWGKVLR